MAVARDRRRHGDRDRRAAAPRAAGKCQCLSYPAVTATVTAPHAAGAAAFTELAAPAGLSQAGHGPGAANLPGPHWQAGPDSQSQSQRVTRDRDSEHCRAGRIGRGGCGHGRDLGPSQAGRFSVGSAAVAALNH